MRLFVRRGTTAAFIAIGVLGCGSDSPTGENGSSRLGAMSLVIAGLPPGTSARVTVIASGYSRSIATSETITGLYPGNYDIIAEQAGNDSTTFFPNEGSQSVLVLPGDPTKVTVTYVVTSASLSLQLSGVPPGATPRLTVVGDDSVPRTVVASEVLKKLKPGAYRITAPGIMSDGDLYAPSGFPRMVHLVASPTPYEVPVAYALASGRVAVSIRGLPNGAPQASIYLNSQTLGITVQHDTVLMAVPAGQYNVVVGPVTAGGKTYGTVPTQFKIDVPVSRSPTELPITYHPPKGRLTIRTEGLPPGTPAPVELAGFGYENVQVIDELIKTDVTVGDLQVYPQKVDLSTGLYEVRDIQPHNSFAMGPDSSFVMTIRYELVTALLAINVQGLSPGVDPDLLLYDNGGPERPITKPGIVRIRTPRVTIGVWDVQTATSGFIAAQRAYDFFLDTSTTPVPATIVYENVGPVNLSIAAVRVMQAAYRVDGSVPLVADRDALITAFIKGDTTNAAKPSVRVRLFHSGTLVHTMTFPGSGLGVQTTAPLGDIVGWFRARIPGTWVQPGLSVLVDVDAGNAYVESSESDNVFPLSQTPMPVHVVAVRPVEITFVPIIQEQYPIAGTVNSTNIAQFLRDPLRMLPLGNVTAKIRAPFTVTGPALTADNSFDSWMGAANQLAALHAAEGAGTYYYGVARLNYLEGIVGIGQVGGRVAMGWDRLPSGSQVMAHELGHNFGLLHAPCGTQDGLDPRFPYAGGGIGFGGFDLATGQAVGGRPDIMGYCDNPWISDYSWEQALTGLSLGSPSARRQPARGGAEPGLLVWGRVKNGQPILEPTFEVRAPALLPTRAGPHAIEITAEDGARLVMLSFAGERVDHRRSDEHFAFVVPLSHMRGARPGAVRLTSNGRTVEFRAGAVASPPTADRPGKDYVRVTTPAPGVRGLLVRDPNTGEILGLGRGPSVHVATRSDDLEVIASDGVRSTAHRLRTIPRK